MTLVQDFRAAYLSFWRWVGIAVAIFAVLSWLTHGWAFPLSDIPMRLVRAYRAVFHPAMQLLFGWLPWRLPDWWKDTASLYFVLGGAVGRTLWAFYEAHDSEKGEPYGPYLVGRFKGRAAKTVAVLLSIPLWPITLLLLLATPYVMRNPNNGNVFAGNEKRYRVWRAERRRYDYVCNLRSVFLLQLAAVITVCAALIITSWPA